MIEIPVIPAPAKNAQAKDDLPEATVTAPRVAFATVGCRVNQAESDDFARDFAAAGYRIVPWTEQAEVYVVNTCTVTHHGDSDSRRLIRQAHRRNPTALIVATGCFVSASPQAAAEVEGVGLLISNSEKDQLVERVHAAVGLPVPEGHTVVPPALAGVSGRTRTFVKVQDGCEDHCTYCIVPTARGPERSIPADRIVAEIQQRVEAGYQEAVLTGVSIGTYRYDSPTDRNGAGLAKLVRRILAETEIPRLRISSLEPQHFDDDLVEVLATSPRLCHHFHLAIQSGSRSVLKRMVRRYTPEQFAAVVERLRAVAPDVAITTDLMVGFPGETDEEHEESHRFCQTVGFADMHVFRYSPRAGTPATRLRNPVDEPTKKRRSAQMLELASQLREQFRRSQLGSVHDVLIEHATEGQPGRWAGLTGNYLRVYVDSNEPLEGRLVRARLTGLAADGVVGELLVA